MSLFKHVLIVVGMMVLLPHLVAAAPDWVNAYASSPALGVKALKHEIIFEWLKVELQPQDHRSLHHFRVVIRVGGQGNFGDISYSVQHTGSERFRVMGAWQIDAAGHVAALPDKALTRSNVFRDDVLYSDDYVSSWVLNNAQMGTLLIVEYELEYDDLLDFGLIYLQGDERKRDSTVIEFAVPKGSVLRIVPFESDSQTVVVTGDKVTVGPLAEWKTAPLSGGYSVGAARIEYLLYPSGNREIPPRTWNDVSNSALARWTKIKTSMDLPYAPVGPSLDSIRSFLWQFEKDFRYVAIAIGEGHFVPHRPDQVLKMKYGDCKDLSFFLTNYLSAHDVPTYPVLVNVPAEDPFDTTFPSAYQFNHAIVAILAGSDTLYYDPTSRGYELGVLPWGDQGAPALWLKEGSDLRRLPLDTVPYVQDRRLEGTLDLNGHFEGTVSVTVDPRAPRWESTNQLEETLKKTLHSVLREDLTAEITSVSWRDSAHTISAHLAFSGYARKVSNLLYWKPYPFSANVVDSVPLNSPQGYYWDRPTRKHDCVRVALPKEILPLDSVAIESRPSVGCVSLNLKIDSAQVVFGEWVSENSSFHYPSSSRAALDSFLTSISLTRNYRLKLVPRE
jgi:hypothetical protein